VCPAAAAFSRFEIADRGRYEVCESHAEPELVALVTHLASERLGMALAPAGQRLLRFRRGDYALFKDDHKRWQGLDALAEVTVDLSASESDEGQVVYAFPDGRATMPQRPGAAAIVDRRGQAARYERYLGVRFGEGEILRLHVILRG